MDRLLLRPVEVGDVLGVSRAMAYKLVRDGVVPSIRIGRSVRVPADRLRAWVEARAAESGP
ncbi:MAG: helix-turn-helix domain-containing protein [Chloroflexi bacterium]|nr:helix-turn-helix domain-containing protein [Chloroflexota bacterium]